MLWPLLRLGGALDDSVHSDSSVDSLSSLSLVEHRRLALASSMVSRGECSGVMNGGVLMAGGWSVERRPSRRLVNSLLLLAASPAAWEVLTSLTCPALPPLRFALDALDCSALSIWGNHHQKPVRISLSPPSRLSVTHLAP